MKTGIRVIAKWSVAVVSCSSLSRARREAQGHHRRKTAAGPGGTDQQSILLLIRSPQTQVLGIAVATGDASLGKKSRGRARHA